MGTTASTMQTNPRHDLNAAVRRRFIQVGLLFLIQAVALFGLAGHLNWLAAWIYLGIYLGFLVVNAALLWPHGKELIAERGKYKANTKGWDKVVILSAGIFFIVLLVVAALDDRYGWSPFSVISLRIGAVVLQILGYGLFSWALASNPYFTTTVRIQKDRGQTVVSNGPYQYVRHPGYVGSIILTLAAPFVLGSLLALVPAVLLCITMIVRTRLEDKTLQEELDGYKAYTQRVHYRLLPGVW